MDTLERIIAAAGRQGIQAISFTGGEPLLDLDRLVAFIHCAGRAGIPFIRTGTNGFMFARPDKNGFEDRIARIAERLAQTPLRNFWISLDSAVDRVHEQMRGFPGVVTGIARALPIFHRAGIYPAVNLGINRNVGTGTLSLPPSQNFSSRSNYLETFYYRYKNAFEQFYRRVLDLGFSMANTCYPMSIAEPESQRGLSAVYAATTTTDIVRFAADEKHMLFQALSDVIGRFRARLRIFTPQSSLKALIRQYGTPQAPRSSYGCRGGVDFFFINAADGHTYPCGYRGQDDFGPLPTVKLKTRSPGPDEQLCRRCDWECFRDPSEMFGPFLELTARPLNFMRRFALHPQALSTWLTDLQYYHACDLFDGRSQPDLKKLNRFSPTKKEAKCESTCTCTRNFPSAQRSGF
jgi:hypothetical protein